MPFGLTNIPATFQRLMGHCLGDQNFETILIYLYIYIYIDIIVFAPNFGSHLQRLDFRVRYRAGNSHENVYTLSRYDLDTKLKSDEMPTFQYGRTTIEPEFVQAYLLIF